MNIADRLTGAAPAARLALDVGKEGCRSSLTFGELDALARGVAGYLESLGIRRGDRIVFLAPPSVALYAAIIAAFRLGAPAVFLDPRSGIGRLHRVADEIRAQALIATRPVLAMCWIVPALRAIPLRMGIGRLLNRSQGAETPHDASPGAAVEADHPALVSFTGGSTDAAGPRAVSRSHGLLAAQHEALSSALPSEPGDIDFTGFPMVVLHNLAAGIPSLCSPVDPRRPAAFRPEQVLARMLDLDVRTASASPTLWTGLADACEASGQRLALRRIVVGGAPVHPRLVARLARIAPGAEIVGIYGGTEAEPVAILPYADRLPELEARVAGGSGLALGWPVAGITVRLVADDGRDTAAGEVGEIWVSGAHVAASAAHDASGRAWHRMGDLAYRDPDGCLWLVGRIHNRIFRHGRTVYPVPIEAVAECLPSVRRAALAGLADAALGERAILAVELIDGEQFDDWSESLLRIGRGLGWMLDEVRAVRTIPLDARHGARIDYRRLREALI